MSGAPYNAQLAKLIDADPDDAGAWAVYADWLQAQGDPRGELGVIQERLRAKPKAPAKVLRAAERRLLDQHERLLVGDLAYFMTTTAHPKLPSVTDQPAPEPEDRDDVHAATLPPVRVRWRAGFFAELFVGHPGYVWTPVTPRKDNRAGIDVLELLLAALASPAARFVTSLRLGTPNNPDDGSVDYTTIIAKLAKHDALTRLRSLYIGDIAPDEHEVSWIVLGDISKLYRGLGNLRSLTLRGGSLLKLGTIALPELRELTIITGGLDAKNVAAIAAAKWPKLERLELWFGSSSYGANTSLEDIVPLLERKRFPKLVHLGLRNCELADDLAPAIATSSIIKQLATLDLSKGMLTDTGVAALAAHRRALAQLRVLDLSDNFLTKPARAASLAKTVRTTPQRRPNTYNEQRRHYVALGE